MAKNLEITGNYQTTRWRAKDSDYVIGFLDDGETVVAGNAPEGDLVPGCPYRFFGQWRDTKHGKQFNFKQYLKLEPNSRAGVVNYLARYAPGVGPKIAGELFDAFGGEAVRVLRTDPGRAAGASRLSLAKAKQAAVELTKLVALEDTKIELNGLFAGRGFPLALVDECVRAWGILAPHHVKRDPFTLLVGDFKGCGFARCDRLYLDLGHPADKLKRQMICLWQIVQSDMNGHTWHRLADVVQELGRMVSGARVQAKAAIKLGRRAGWLATYRDDQGELWIAAGKRAMSENYLAERLREWTA